MSATASVHAVIVDPFSSGAEYAAAFAEFGVTAVAVHSRPEPPAVYIPSYRPGDFSEIYYHEGNPDSLAARLDALQPLCVLPGADSGVELADLLAARLTPTRANLPGLTAARRHKGRMMEALAAAGIPCLRQLTSSDRDEVAAWLGQTGLERRDIVIKPPVSASTDGVTRIRAGGDWRSVFDRQLGARNQWDIVNTSMVVQEFAEGEEYVVDSCSIGGVHSIANVCRYLKRRSDANIGVYDRMRWLPPESEEVPELAAYARAALDAIGLRTGPAHTEIMLTANGPRLIEVNARPHGGGHPRFCRTATGDSQLHRAVRAIAAGEELPDSYTLLRPTQVVFLISPRAGRLRNVEVLERIRELPSLHHLQLGVANGDYVASTGDLLTSQAFGFAVLSHPDPTQLDRDETLIRSLESVLEIEPVQQQRELA
jgi:biotin carboxylase